MAPRFSLGLLVFAMISVSAMGQGNITAQGSLTAQVAVQVGTSVMTNGNVTLGDMNTTGSRLSSDGSLALVTNNWVVPEMLTLGPGGISIYARTSCILCNPVSHPPALYVSNRDPFTADPTEAATFVGNVGVAGTLWKSAGSFKIDHPLDPANKYLSHSFVESPDMKNYYDGIVTLTSGGEAVVELPEWFEALNENYRYQLTCVGGYAPVYIAEEIAGNHFKIAGGKAGLKVSWAVTGVRHDRYAEAHRIRVEEAKPALERGRFLSPELFGFAPEFSVFDAHQRLQRSLLQTKR
jgi:hypothetical protein